jgi:hypothetical protein
MNSGKSKKRHFFHARNIKEMGAELFAVKKNEKINLEEINYYG